MNPELQSVSMPRREGDSGGSMPYHEIYFADAFLNFDEMFVVFDWACQVGTKESSHF